MKLQEYLTTYDGKPITIKELANALGYAEGSVRNKKKMFQEAGIVFHHGNTGMRGDKRDLEPLDNRKAYTLPASPRLYKSAAVFVAIELKEPPLFLVTPATYKASIGKGLTIRCACSYIRRCIAHPEIKPRDKTLLEDTLALAKEARPTRDTLALAKEARPTRDTLALAKEARPTRDTLALAKEARPTRDTLALAKEHRKNA